MASDDEILGVAGGDDEIMGVAGGDDEIIGVAGGYDEIVGVAVPEDEIVGVAGADDEIVGVAGADDEIVNTADRFLQIEIIPVLEQNTELEKANNRVQSIHISSRVFARKSVYFQMLLFHPDMLEGKQDNVRLVLEAHEESAFMHLLTFMYSNSLDLDSVSDLLAVLMVAERFQVPSCKELCVSLLLNLDMTLAGAAMCLDLPKSVLTSEIVQPLFSATKNYVTDLYKDITRFEKEIFDLPLAGVEAVLAFDGLQVASEDVVYDILLNWYKNLEPKSEDSRTILSDLARFIRFPFMTCKKLREVMYCKDLDQQVKQRDVVAALFFKAETSHRQRLLDADEIPNTYRQFIERAYTYRLVKVVEFDMPRQRCVVYMDLKRTECVGLFPRGQVSSQAFHLGDREFFLSARCNWDDRSSCYCFGLFVGMRKTVLGEFSADFELAACSKRSQEYTSILQGTSTFSARNRKMAGSKNLFKVSWESFIAEGSDYFINGVLQLRAQLTVGN